MSKLPKELIPAAGKFEPQKTYDWRLDVRSNEFVLTLIHGEFRRRWRLVNGFFSSEGTNAITIRYDNAEPIEEETKP
jgi:hypothetical protein